MLTVHFLQLNSNKRYKVKWVTHTFSADSNVAITFSADSYVAITLVYVRQEITPPPPLCPPCDSECKYLDY